MRHPSVRGLGIRYLIAVLLPISGAVLVVYTAVQLAIAHATHNVPPPRRIAEASILSDYVPGQSGPDAEPAPTPAPAAR